MANPAVLNTTALQPIRLPSFRFRALKVALRRHGNEYFFAGFAIFAAFAVRLQ
jgi:hypothetical protein